MISTLADLAGKYTEGQAKDPKTWKANFRCALNSLPDIEEVKDRSVNKGHHAKRVFKMLPQASKSRGERKLCLLCVHQVFVSVCVCVWVAHTNLCLSPLDKRTKGKATKTHRRKVTEADLHIFSSV